MATFQLIRRLASAAALVALALPATVLAAKPLVVGSTNFPEQLVLANIYAEALTDHGIAVRKRLNLGSREIVFPALKNGEIDVLPEYSGALLGYLSNGQSKAGQPDAVMAALKDALPSGVVALAPSPAQDKDGLVVTPETAERYDLKNLSDLAPVAAKLTLGGPPETQTRYVGVPGLKAVYGIEFGQFRALDAGGPLTQGALSSGAIDVARMFTTQGVIDERGWILLKDDKNLVPAQNIVPVARKTALTPEIRDVLNAVSAQLSTADLQRMNRRVSVDHADPRQVAHGWLEQHDL
ncbi:MAG: quaternary ammonium transporter [Xanthomonadales bacterium]|nr:quaternary ammonium transporter [Xanthomonadales bacterium]